MPTLENTLGPNQPSVTYESQCRCGQTVELMQDDRDKRIFYLACPACGMKDCLTVIENDDWTGFWENAN